MALATEDVMAESCLSQADWKPANQTGGHEHKSTMSGARFPHRYRLSFAGGDLVGEVSADSPDSVLKTIQSLGRLSQLRADWDSYGGRPIDVKCAEGALNVAMDKFRHDSPAPSAVPTSRGGVQLEWHCRGIDLEVEFLSSVRLNVFFEDRSSGETWEEDMCSDLRKLDEAIAKLSD